MFPSRMPFAGSICTSRGDSSIQVKPLLVERKMPSCSVPIHRSPTTGLTPRLYTLLPMPAAEETLIVVCPTLVETHAPLLGEGAQKPPHTTVVLAGKTHPVSAAAALRWPVGITLQLPPSLVER